MAVGIYQAFKRRNEIASTEPVVFTNNIQVILSVFAFSTFIISFLGTGIDWVLSRQGVHPVIIGGVIAVCAMFLALFFVLAIYTFIQLVKMLWRGKRGVRYEFNPDTIPANVLKATRTISIDTNLKEYKHILQRLIKEKTQLIEEQDKLIAEYSEAIREMEKKDDKPKSEQPES